MRNLTLDLKMYSFLACSYIAVNHSNAQIIYYDLEPDVVLDGDYDGYWLDIDLDGLEDYAFLNTHASFTGSNSGIDYSFIADACWAGPYINSNNAIVGDKHHISGYGGGFTVYNIDALDINIEISLKMDYYSFGFQRFAFLLNQNSDEFGWVIGNSGGNWFPNVADKYIGVKFQDSDEDFHFGWIRCSVLDSAKVLVIKDYAYEAHAGKPIHAGDTSNLISFFESENNLDASIYAFDETIFIQLKTKEETQINIYNLLGEKIYSEKINTNTTEIKRKETGIFIVELLSADKKMVKKVFVE